STHEPNHVPSHAKSLHGQYANQALEYQHYAGADVHLLRLPDLCRDTAGAESLIIPQYQNLAPGGQGFPEFCPPAFLRLWPLKRDAASADSANACEYAQRLVERGLY